VHIGEPPPGSYDHNDGAITVIGTAANEAARLAGLCKTLGQAVLISSAFPRCFPNEMVSLGFHHLRNVEHTQEIFTLSDGRVTRAN